MENYTQDKLTAKEYFAVRNQRRLADIEKNVPEEMKAMPNWCIFKTYYDKEKDMRRKIMLDCNTGHWASPTDASTWTGFNRAIEHAKTGNYEGLSFALKGSGVSCIDLDGCIDEQGKRSSLAWDVLNKSNTYSEKSISNKGIHIFLKGNFLEGYKNKTRDGKLEAYDSNHFMNVTGNIISKTNELMPASEELQAYIKEKLGKKSMERTNESGSSGQSELEVIERIRRSKKGEVFDLLYGGADIKGDKSVSDLTLLNILAFFTNCDKNQMENIFKQSGLYRPEKKDRYIQISIDKAISTLSILSIRPNNSNSFGVHKNQSNNSK
ncbi:MAG: hypothetical protein LBT30_01470 [Clostridiales bacterium]|jgi:putative DNA primase/helicase|nr:hypothetical protein [Clostridiales bacterium]